MYGKSAAALIRVEFILTQADVTLLRRSEVASSLIKKQINCRS